MTTSAIPAVPPGFGTAEAGLWASLFADWPVDQFKHSDLPLIGEYVRAISLADRLAGDIAKASDTAELSKLLDLRDREARRAAALARTLRIAPQSRYDRHATATAANRGRYVEPENPFNEF